MFVEIKILCIGIHCIGIVLTYMWNLKKKSQLHRNREQKSDHQGQGKEGNGEMEVKLVVL